MVNIDPLITRNLQHIWHPCAQMKDFEAGPPLIIHEAKGSMLYTDRGPLIDGIASWWCKSLGHGHPAVIAAIEKQLKQFEHVIGTNTTHPILVEFAEKMASLTGLQHLFFASDGSCAVEIAMKLCLHAFQLRGQSQRNEFIALKNAYHGETLGALSVSDSGRFKAPFTGLGVHCHFIETIPYVNGQEHSEWANAERHWQQTLPGLEAIKDKVCAVIVEPLVQGANAMQCYSADYLRRLANWAGENQIYLIADEIMTGMGRTGHWLASELAGIQPDLICLSKGLTSGTLPLSCVLIDHPIYELFYNDYSTGKSFLHSHTYSGNALAISAALATIKAMEAEQINQRAQALGAFMREQFSEVARSSGRLINIRGIGAIVAGDLVDCADPRPGFKLYQEALKRGALIRPIGNSVYWLPPLNINFETIEKLAEITLHSIRALD